MNQNPSADKKKKEKKQDFVYESELDYVKRQIKRARTLLWWYISGLLLASLAYLAFHLLFFKLPGPIFPLEWRAVTANSGLSERAFDWGLWSLVGTIVFLLLEVQKYYRVIPKLAKEGSPNLSYEPSFIEYSPWHISTLIRGPLIAVVILLFLNAANLNLTGNNGEEAIKLTFSELDHRATLLLAFILGCHHRVARNVLNGIVKSLFSKAWAEANEDFVIEPDEAKLVLGETKMFKTNPRTDVIWSASLGTIDNTGKFTAPKDPEHCNVRIVISAISTGKQTISRSVTVTVVPFEIYGEKEIVLSEKSAQFAYSISPFLENVKWDLLPGEGGGTIDKKGVYTPPQLGEEKTEKVMILAKTTMKDSAGKDRECSSSIDVKLRK